MNEHAPIFEFTVYEGFVEENRPPGTAILTSTSSALIVKSVDRDSGPNALVGYRMTNGNHSHFAVDFISGAIRTLQMLDYDEVN